MKQKLDPDTMPLGTVVAICEAVGFEQEVYPDFVRACEHRRTIG